MLRGPEIDRVSLPACCEVRAGHARCMITFGVGYVGGAFMVFYEEQKERRAGRNLSLLQGAQEYTLGDIPFGLEGCFRLGKRHIVII